MAEKSEKQSSKISGGFAVPDGAPAKSRQARSPRESDAVQIGRRSFLKAAGFSLAGTALAGCQRAPVEKAIPFLVQPEEITPGRSLYYASTCAGCSAGCGLLVKNRDGRPIKLEGNSSHPLSRGGLCAVGQASILGLYDNLRFRNPLHRGSETTWEEVDRAVTQQLEEIRSGQGLVRILTGTVNSPTALAVIDQFIESFPGALRVSYDPLPCSAILDAHQRTHGLRVLPRYRFDRAEAALSLDADFLGTWISPVEYSHGYAAARSSSHSAARPFLHVQVESRLSLTGSKADERIVLGPEEIHDFAAQIASEVALLAGAEAPPYSASRLVVPVEQAKRLAELLWQRRGRGLIVAGSQRVQTQILCNYVNHLLGNYGEVLDLVSPSLQKTADESGLERLVAELNANQVKALLVWGVNPVYDLPALGPWEAWLKNVPLLVSFDERPCETSALAHYVCPDNHYLESWGDRQAVDGFLSLIQPCISPLGATRAFMETLGAWMGDFRPSFELVREHWRTHVFPKQNIETSWEAFWRQALQDGAIQVDTTPPAVAATRFDLSQLSPLRQPGSREGEFDLVLYPKVAMPESRHAYNAWLHELPDPITKMAWDNYACLSPSTARNLRLSEGDIVEIKTSDGDGSAFSLPVQIQPGQHDGVVAVALGYGAVVSQRFADMGPDWLEKKSAVNEEGRVGRNAASMIRFDQGKLHYVGLPVKLRPTGRRTSLASTQMHHSLEVPEALSFPGGQRRPIVQETAWRDLHETGGSDQHQDEAHVHEDLWPADHVYEGRRWGMAIDLDACTGCSACVIACQVENNVPAVGKDEVRRQREMHWLRIDRYYQGDGPDLRVAHQPMLCQHCENAPCETVCPVLATVHSKEGLNQQVYNRCVGTRYCANNCPYKTRRFNWFDYARGEEFENLVLNPDVTVRTRGIMEKCSFCVQRIQEAKIEAKRLGADLKDGDIQTACQQTCPTTAIVFGDLNDPSSRVAGLLESPRRYRVLEELNVKPSVNYLKIVRSAEKEEKHG